MTERQQTSGARIILSDSHLEWSARYASERARLYAALGDLVVEVEHIGSTAVAGLTAAPVVDILVGVVRLPLGDAAIAALRALDYKDRGNGGVPGRYCFGRDGYTLLVVQRDSSLWEEPLRVRDYLRTHADTVVAYAVLKRRLAATGGRLRYTRAKGRFLARRVAAASWRDPAHH